MRGRAHAKALACVAFAVIVVGCSTSRTSSLGDDGGAAPAGGDAIADTSPTEPSADASTESGEATPDAGAYPTLDACAVKRSATAKACDESCGARLTLPARDSFCTIECAQDSDCAGPLSGLLCPETIGACVPSCTTDASCKAAGFLRCDPQTKACDTI